MPRSRSAARLLLSILGSIALAFTLSTELARSRSELQVFEFKQAFVEEIQYQGKGIFTITLRTGEPEVVRRISGVANPDGRLSFVIDADASDGVLVTRNSVAQGANREDQPLTGISLVNLLAQRLKTRSPVSLSSAFDWSPEGQPRKLAYFQVNGGP